MTDSFVTAWTIARQAPLSMGFSRQEYRSGLPFTSPGNLPSPGIKPRPLTSPALAGRLLTTEPPRRPCIPASTGCPCTGRKTHAASPPVLWLARDQLWPRGWGQPAVHTRAAYISQISFRKCAYISTFSKFWKTRSRCWIFSNSFSNSLDVLFFFFFLFRLITWWINLI